MDFFHTLMVELVKIIIFGVDMSSSTKIHNKNKDISIYGQGTTQD